MSRICVNCIKEKHLRKLVEDEGHLGNCTCCGSTALSIDTTYNRFVQLIKALIRFHYSEWDYNTHWGGESYDSLFYGDDNILFNEANAINDELYEDTVIPIISSPVYEEYEKGVTVFAGYMEDGSPAGILKAIKTDRAKELVKISERLKNENYFIVEEELKSVLLKFKGTMEHSLLTGTEFYRARIGVDKEKHAFTMGFEGEIHYSPYKNGEIAAPSPRIAREGRINRSGVSFFYAATDKYTALAEVRPHPGDTVSLGKFSLNRDVIICDFSDSQILHFFESDKLLDKFVLLNTLNLFMNKTVTPSNREHYTITQLIADCLRQMGYDGVVFNSTVGNGKNVTLFYPAHVSYVDADFEVLEVDTVKYEYSSLPLISDDETYY